MKKIVWLINSMDLEELRDLQKDIENNSEIIKKASHSVKFTKKEPAYLSGNNEQRIPVKPVFFNDFNFRVSLQTEEESELHAGFP